MNIHFESRTRGRLGLDIEIAFYEGSIAKHPERIRELTPLLALKPQLHKAVRAAVGDAPYYRSGL